MERQRESALLRRLRLAGEAPRLFVVLVFVGDIIVRNFAGFHFGFIGIGSAFDGVNDFGFEILSLGGKLLDAFGIDRSRAWEIFNIS